MSVRAKGRMTRLLRRLGAGEAREYAFAQFDGDERLTPWYLPGGRELEGEPGPGFALVRIRHVEGLGSPQAKERGTKAAEGGQHARGEHVTTRDALASELGVGHATVGHARSVVSNAQMLAIGQPAMEAGAWDFAGEGDAPCQVTVTFSGGAQVPRDWPAERRASPSRVVVSETSTPPASSAQPDTEQVGETRRAAGFSDLFSPSVEVALCATLVGEPPAQTAGVHGVTRPERRSGAAGGEEVPQDLRTPEPSEAPEGPPERPGGSHREPPETPPAESEIQRLRRLYPHADAGPGSELALLMGDTFDD